ncbi:zinc finger protein 532-like [Glandiceps talaboti]
MTTEVKTPDFDDLLAAYDIPDIADKSSSLEQENSTSNHGNSDHGDIKERSKVKEKVEIVKGKVQAQMEPATDVDVPMEADDEDKLVIDEKDEDVNGMSQLISSDVSKVNDERGKTVRHPDTLKQGNETITDKISKIPSHNEKQGLMETTPTDTKEMNKPPTSDNTCNVKPLSEKVDDQAPINKNISLDAESQQNLATEQLKQLSETVIKDKQMGNSKATTNNITKTVNKVASITTTAPTPKLSLPDTPIQASKNQIKIAPKPALTKIKPTQILTISSGSGVLPPNATTNTTNTAATQRLVVITSSGPGVVTNAVNVAPSKLTNAINVAPSKLTNAVNVVPSKLTNTKSSIVDALENCGPTVNVVVTNNLLKRYNPVPRYTPMIPPKEWNLKVPDGGYKCLECSDSFALETSLGMHLERRSMMIVYVCEICNKKLVFYNKCSLLRHVRLHYSKSAKNITVSLKSVEVTPLSKNITSLWPSRDRLGLPASYIHDVDTAISSSIEAHCSECHVVFSNSNSKKAHLQVNMKGNDTFSCNICGLQCPNKCYFEAHQRIHHNQSPYVCPECGEEKYDRELFYVHLNSTCVHFCRQAVYKCPQCNAGYPNIAHLKSHLQNAHTDSFCKCPVCPMAFKSIENINSHMLSQHKITDHGFRVIHKCPMCDTVFTQKNNVPPHLDSHLLNKENLRIYVFKCNECYKHYDSKEALEKHQLSVHKGVQLKDFICDVCRTPFKTYQFMLQHKNKHFDPKPASQPATVTSPVATKQGKDHTKGDVFTCMHCPMKFSKAQMLNDHIQVHLKKSSPGPGVSAKHNCPDCSASFSKRENLNKHLKYTHGKVANYPCHLCRRSFESNKSLQRHLRLKHKLANMYTCWLCIDKKKTFSKRSLLEHHLKIVHGISMAPQDIKSSPQDVHTPISSLVSRKRKSSSLGDGKKRAKFEFTTDYKCAKCEVECHDRREFQNHIADHKTNPALAQCKECGMCFRGDESLKKHLYMVHKVKDMNEYEMAVNLFEEKGNGSGDGSSSQTSDHTGGSVFKSVQEPALECTVCYRSFDSEVTLRTHMRNHGMAFIKSKRHNSAESQ